MTESSADLLADLNEPSPLRSLLAIGREWSIILLVFWVSIAASRWRSDGIWFCWPVWMICFVIIAIQNNRLLGLMHEAAHGHLFRAREWNDFVGKWICGAPATFTYRIFQNVHAAHHFAPLGPQDPDVSIFGPYPTSGLKFSRRLLRDLTGLTNLRFHILMGLKLFARPGMSWDRISDYGAVVSIQFAIWFGFLLAGHGWYYFWFWLLPPATLGVFLFRIGIVSQHAGLESNADQSLCTRTIVNGWQCFWLAPYGANLHIEHHLYPAIPFFNLQKLHELLRKSGRLPERNFYRSYWPVWKQILRADPTRDNVAKGWKATMATHERLLVTGASGHLGKKVVSLIRESHPDLALIATTRKPERLAPQAGEKLDVRVADFDDPASLDAAFRGATRLLLISTDKIGRRTQQHKNAIDAAKRAGVRHIIYTSLQGADRSPAAAAPEHRETEQYLQQCGVSYTILRNCLYTDNLLMKIPPAIKTGVIFGAAGDGKIAYVTREDCARAAAAALVSANTSSRVLDVTGPRALSFSDLAEISSRIYGKPVSYADQSADEFKATLIKAGLPEAWAPAIVSFDLAAKQGTLEKVSDVFRELTGTAPKDVEDFLRERQNAGH